MDDLWLQLVLKKQKQTTTLRRICIDAGDVKDSGRGAGRGGKKQDGIGLGTRAEKNNLEK